MRPDEVSSRDHLAGLLWGDSANEQARANLRQALTQLRRVFREVGIDPIKTPGDGVMLSAQGLIIDAHRLSSIDSLPGESLLRCEKEFLEGFTVAAPEFENWSAALRESLRGRVRQLHELAADQAIENRRIDKAIEHLTSALKVDPLHEHLHRRVMKLLSAQGRADAAIRQYERCRSVLMQELGIGPEAETKALLQRIQGQRSIDEKYWSERTTQFNKEAPTLISDKPSIAVLAFDNMSGDPKQDYFSDGIVEDIITDLSKFSGLFVIARNSSFAYKGKKLNVRDVCRELGVRFVLEGSVRRAADRVRITAQLIDGENGRHVWAERYDRELNDIFTVQDDVTGAIVAALALELAPDECKLDQRHATDNLKAYDFFLLGREQAFLDTSEANVRARVMLEKAIDLDAQFSLAFSHLSRNHVIAYVNRWGENPEQSLELAMELGQRAVNLDQKNPHAYFAVSAAALWMKRHDVAVTAARKCLSIGPSFAEGHAVLGLVFVYSSKPREAIASLKKAMRLDPHYRDIYLHLLALAHVQLEDYEAAVAVLERRLLRKPDSDISRVLLAAIHGHMGNSAESRKQWLEALRINPSYSLEHRRRILPYRNPADFEHVLNGLRKAGLMEGDIPTARL